MSQPAISAIRLTAALTTREVAFPNAFAVFAGVHEDREVLSKESKPGMPMPRCR